MPRKTAPLSLREKLAQHLQADLAMQPVVERSFQTYEHGDLHQALERLCAESSPPAVLLGVIGTEYETELSLAKITHPLAAAQYHEAAVQYVDVSVGLDTEVSCVRCGIYLLTVEQQRLACMIQRQDEPWRSGVRLQVMSADRAGAENFVRRVAKETRRGETYRGKVISLSVDCHRQLQISFHALPRISADHLILPRDVLARLERQTVGFVEHRARLLQSKRHLKRGILLHGPPGTGKTLSAMYVATRMTGRTTILITGGGIGLIELAGRLARMLEPATVILEDVDLIGTMREQQAIGANALLFELLNEMDGLHEDADVLFILTTNRPDVLEPALASRPGRIDQAIEVPLPDADCRRRLIDLYRSGLRCEVHDWRPWIQRTEGSSAAFMREFLRKAALFAADDSTGDEIVVGNEHLDAALGELAIAGGRLTRALLGSSDVAAGANAT